MNKALDQARQVKDVTLRQGSRNSYPIYDSKDQKITGWRRRAELRLESSDFAALSKLTGELLGDPENGQHGLRHRRSDAQGQRRRCPAQDAVRRSRLARNWPPMRWVARAYKIVRPEPQQQWLSTALHARRR